MLPALTFALSLSVFAAFLTLTYTNLRQMSARDRGIILQTLRVKERVPGDHLLLASVLGSATILTRPLQAVHMPAMAVEAAASGIMRTWPDSWRPRDFGPTPAGLFLWRAIIFPVYCLPFWWFAGLGIDGLRARRQLRWPVLLAGTMLCAAVLFVSTALVCAYERRVDRDMAWVFCGFALWALLLSTFPIGWVRGLLQRRKTVAMENSVENILSSPKSCK